MERKRLLSELVFAYRKRGREVVDLFVEGGKDKLLIDRFIAETARSQVAVYSMDSIDFSGTDFNKLGLLAPSARSEVIALRKAMHEAGVDLDGMLFLVDRDQEDLVPTPHINGVTLTDSGALPVHLFDNRVEGLICAMLLAGRVSVEVLKKSVVNVCSSIYAVRSAALMLRVPAKIQSPKDFLVRGDGGIYSLDVDGYLQRCLHAGKAIEHIGEMRKCVEEVLVKIDGLKVPRFVFLNDHDLWAVLRDLFHKFGDNSNKSADDIEGAVLMTFNANELSGQALFKGISALFSGPAEIRGESRIACSA